MITGLVGNSDQRLIKLIELVDLLKSKKQNQPPKPTQIEAHKKAEAIHQQIVEQPDHQQINLHEDLGEQKNDLLSVEDQTHLDRVQ